MLDATNPNILSPRSWLDEVTPGDIVMFKEPSLYLYADDSEAKPYLVFEVNTIGDNIFLVLAASCPIKSTIQRSFELHVRSDAAKEAAGLGSPTCFQFNNRVIIVDAHEGYCLQASGTAVIGRLSGAEWARFEAERTPAKIQSNRRSCQWAVEHLLPLQNWMPEARRNMVVPPPYSLQELAQPSVEI